jgi:tetratricopeptide (TPR) repeat protein
MTSTELFEQAEIKLHEKDFKESIRLYAEAIAEDQNNAHYISQRAVAFFHLGKFEEALYDFNHALELEPENPFRYSSRAFILSNMNKINEAIKDYERAIELDPSDSVAHNNLGLLQEQVGFDELAKQSYSKADKIEGIELNGSPDILNNELSNEQDDSLKIVLDPEIQQLGINYKDMNYLQFIKMVFTHKKVRSDFFRFLMNGFKLK